VVSAKRAETGSMEMTALSAARLPTSGGPADRVRAGSAAEVFPGQAVVLDCPAGWITSSW
jgi:hypothetical protein